MSTQIPSSIHSVYLMGIAGIGMSALAQYFAHRGVRVAGYDADRSPVAQALENSGITVHYTEEESMLAETPDLVIYTPAVPATHKGLQYYREQGVPVVKRAQVLGWISMQHRCIAVAGTHGKTTTSALITWVLKNCGVDVTAFLGGIVPDLGGNYVRGASDWVIAEADEYDRSFHALSPEIAVVTSMDADHLDIYGTFEEMVAGYVGFLDRVHNDGTVIVQNDVLRRLDPAVTARLRDRGVAVISYGEENGDYRVTDAERAGSGTSFTLHDATRSEKITLAMPGMHNALNATAAIITGDLLRMERHCMNDALSRFHGIRRRFEVVFANDVLTVIDDYAHHPQELAAAIGAARLQYPGAHLTGVFQPHLYSRTRDFYREFAAALDTLDTCVLVELYPAREQPIEGVSEEMIFHAMRNESRHLSKKNNLTALLVSLRPQVLLFLGAGDLDRMIPGVWKAMTQQ